LSWSGELLEIDLAELNWKTVLLEVTIAILEVAAVKGKEGEVSLSILYCCAQTEWQKASKRCNWGMWQKREQWRVRRTGSGGEEGGKKERKKRARQANSQWLRGVNLLDRSLGVHVAADAGVVGGKRATQRENRKEKTGRNVQNWKVTRKEERGMIWRELLV
jgi:hypothetical protein